MRLRHLVERAGGLVEEQDTRPRDECPCDEKLLQLAARERVHGSLGEVAQLE